MTENNTPGKVPVALTEDYLQIAIRESEAGKRHLAPSPVKLQVAVAIGLRTITHLLKDLKTTCQSKLLTPVRASSKGTN